MAYFNHSFTKMFLGTGATRGASPVTTGGFITEGGIPTGAANTTDAALANLTPGYFGFFDPNTYVSLTTGDLAGCCPLMLASSSLLAQDKLSRFHGGYKETNKSKLINPKYVQRVYKVEACTPQQSIVSVGTTPQTTIGGLPTERFQGGTLQANCQYDFLCGETYYLRVDVKGSPALRALNHNAYQNVDAYTGCCSGPTPTAVDPTTVYIQWATKIIENNYLNNFITAVVFDTVGGAWFAPGTTVDPIDGVTPVLPARWWSAYVSPAGPFAGLTTGMRLIGAYVDTTFGNCSFQITDFFEKEPVRIYASLVDMNGDPCVFEGLCVYNDCYGLKFMGFGEQVVRDLIKAESYLQNFFSTDIRIREITQGNQILDSVSRNALYTRYYILHSVPRFNNPTGVFDNDRYMLEIITPEAGNAALETFLTTWLGACVDCVTLEEHTCTPCVTPPNVDPAP